MFLIEPAFADTPAPTTTTHSAAAASAHHASSFQGILLNLLPFILIFIVFYFILIVPQRRKQKAHRALMDALSVGNKVVLSSGIVGKVIRIRDNQTVVIQTADSSEIEVYKQFIANVIKD